MNAEQATDILGVNRRRHGNLREVLRALTLYPWLNTAEDEKRRIAARWALTHGKSTRTNAPGAARRDPPEPGRQVFDADRTCSRSSRILPSPTKVRWLDLPHILGRM